MVPMYPTSPTVPSPVSQPWPCCLRQVGELAFDHWLLQALATSILSEMQIHARHGAGTIFQHQASIPFFVGLLELEKNLHVVPARSPSLHSA